MQILCPCVCGATVDRAAVVVVASVEALNCSGNYTHSTNLGVGFHQHADPLSL